MKRRFILYRRKLGGMFYIKDAENKLPVCEYLTALPKESVLAAEVAHTRELLERQAEVRRMARGKSS